MGNVIDFNDAVKALRKGAGETIEAVSKGASKATGKTVVSKTTQESIEAAAKKTAAALKASKESADALKMSQQRAAKRIEDAARRSAKKIQGAHNKKIAAERIASSELHNKKGAAERIASSELYNKQMEIVAKNKGKQVNPVNKERLKELRSKYKGVLAENQQANYSNKNYSTTIGEVRAGSSNFDGSKSKKTHERQRKIYANRQYNKEKGRLNYNLENGDLKEKISAKIGLNKLDKKDFMPTTRTSKNKGIDFDKNSFAYKAAGLGVGGAIVFSMANNKGQQSNSQLYGQG